MSETPSVLSKAVQIVDVIASAGVVGTSEIARRTKIAKTTVHRTALELCQVGLVERSGDGFRLAPKLFEWGSQVPRRRDLREAALPFLEQLSYASNQTVHLAVLDGSDVLYVERLVGERSNEVPSAVAARLPLHCTATGKCLLAFGPQELLANITNEQLERRTERSITDPDVLRTELESVRESAVAKEAGEIHGDLCSIAAPVWRFGGQLVGAISATGPIEDYDAVRNEELVRLSARALSERLGHDMRHRSE